MTASDQEYRPSDAMRLLQEEVDLLRDIKASLISLQDSQNALQQGIDLTSRPTTYGITDVFIKNLNMPFFSMVRFMIKWTIASIPAGVILFLLALLIFLVVSLLLGGTASLLTLFQNLGK